MPFVSYFTSAFKPPFRSDNHRSSRKRKRERSSSDEDSTNSEVNTRPNSGKTGSSVSGSLTSGFSSTAVPSILRRELAVQYQASGQAFDAELPSLNFPHASLSGNATGLILNDTKTAVQDDLATLKPPLNRTKLNASWHYSAREAIGNGNFGLRQNHLDNLTAVLYRCVHEADFLRAGRAWGMLLRAEKSGHGMDIRKCGRWGLGAEILLNRDAYLVKGVRGEGQGPWHAEDSTDDQVTKFHRGWFSREGFENAKDYYARLILQYPYRKASPTATSALDFYPAMFGLWLYVVQDQHKTAMKGVGKPTRNSVDSSTETSVDEGAILSSVPESSKHQRMVEIRNHTVQCGNEIASRLDELLVSPPYSDDSRLWRLRGMVALWVADLWIFALPLPTDAEFSEGETSLTPEPTSPGTSGWHPQVISEHERCRANRQVAISKAEQAFKNAVEKG